MGSMADGAGGTELPVFPAGVPASPGPAELAKIRRPISATEPRNDEDRKLAAAILGTSHHAPPPLATA